METSIFLAKTIGLFSVISVLAILVHYKTFVEIEAEAVKNPVFIYFSGFFALIIGVLLVVVHSVWSRDWRLIITIFGWAILIKGALRIFFPEMVKMLVEKKKKNPWFLLGEVLVLLVGFYLIYKGFVT